MDVLIIYSDNDKVFPTIAFVPDMIESDIELLKRLNGKCVNAVDTSEEDSDLIMEIDKKYIQKQYEGETPSVKELKKPTIVFNIGFLC